MIARNYQENAAAVSHAQLVSAWSFYEGLGYRPIPLKGFAAETYKQAKQPTIRNWQHAKPRRQDLSYLAGLGLVVGKKSNHIVLDCDSVEFIQAFNSALPNLAKTWVVQTGSLGRHYHFRTEFDMKMPATMRFSGQFDFMAAKGYVVAPPTEYESYSWLTIEGKPEKPHILNQAAVNEIVEFCRVYRGDYAKPTTEQQAFYHLGDLCLLFDSLIMTKPRNEALFLTALSAHGNGYSAAEIAAELLEHFVHCPPSRKTQNHHRETEQQRRNEGLNAISSACSGKYKVTRQAPRLENVPANHLREYLLKQEETAALRLLEALYHFGVVGGQAMTRLEIEETVSGVLSAKQCRTALESKIFAAKFANFGRVVTHRNKSARLASSSGIYVLKKADGGLALGQTAKSNATNLVCRGEKWATVESTPKNELGQFVEKLYTIPPLEGLLAAYALENKGSDLIPLEALKSAKTYRIAWLYAFIARCPNRWSWRFLAGIIGVHRDSIKSYAKQAGLTVIPQIERQTINRYNATDLVHEHAAEFGRFGYWLEDYAGNRHAPNLKTALRLLRYGSVTLCKQLPNYFTTEPAAIPPHILNCQPKEGKSHD